MIREIILATSRLKEVERNMGTETVKELVEIALENSPSASFGLAYEYVMMKGGGERLAVLAAKGTRFLAKIRRDHGEQKFWEVVEKHGWR